MARRAAPHRGIDVHYGDADPADDSSDASDSGPARPSRTQLKQHAQSLQALGLQVTELPAERLKSLDLPEALRGAIDELRRTRSFEGRRRQLQYVGKLMRRADEAMLREAVAEASLGSARETLLLHDTERWRAELLAGDEALNEWLQQHPDTDLQHLRSLVRAARRDAQTQALAQSKGPGGDTRQPKSFRELFQFIKPALAQQHSSSAQAVQHSSSADPNSSPEP